MSIESFKSVEESCRRFLEGDSSPADKAHFCLSTIVRERRLPGGSVVLKERS
jgi:hypothetical protein